ncbi:phosphoglycerate mutase family protein [Kineosporia rhizophila]|uniref:histidine phosphatase family protein n=1 Tax=Kineosporia rhizophila TaxID=84633 RepID=UPI001E35D829|nr:histidine phosphatase family protein [Kineosporia rhizophila]MCE0540457.1 phosphoglycerate mutase family protein [Kineosporia rhizophila]
MIVYVVSHPEVRVDPLVPVPQWQLSAAGQERVQRLVAMPWARSAGFVASSAERKALQTAQAMAEASGCRVHVDAELGENDRSATGFVPPQEFEALADAFFAEPERSVLGWETALDAQQRIVRAVDRVLELARPAVGTRDGGSVVLATHGGVGTLLQCALRGVAISRRFDQPGQGSWYSFDSVTRQVAQGWQRL